MTSDSLEVLPRILMQLLSGWSICIPVSLLSTDWVLRLSRSDFCSFSNFLLQHIPLALLYISVHPIDAWREEVSSDLEPPGHPGRQSLLTRMSFLLVVESHFWHHCNAGRYFHNTTPVINKHLVIFIISWYRVTWRLLPLSAFGSRLTGSKTIPHIYTVKCIHHS